MSILAHRKRRQTEEKSHHNVRKLNRKFKLRAKKRNFIKPEAFINAYRKAERDANRMRRALLTKSVFNLPNERQQLLCVYRHRAHRIASEVTQRMLNSLRIGQLHNVAFLRNNEQNTALLKLVEPYVCWGYPTITTVREIIFKHGFMKVDGKKTAITSNKMIEDALGSSGIICIEDIVHETFSVTDNFEKIQLSLLPFHVSYTFDVHLFYTINNNPFSYRLRRQKTDSNVKQVLVGAVAENMAIANTILTK